MTSRPACVRMLDAPILDAKQLLADRHAARRIAVGHLAPDHALDDAALADRLLVRVERLDGRAVADDGDLVGDLRDLVELVRDEDRGHALRLEFEQQVQQRRAVGLVEARGRLVENQQLDVLGERLGDLDQLLLADADVGDERVRRFASGPPCAISSRARRKQRPQSMTPLRRRLVAEKDVLGDRELRRERQLLVDDDDAEVFAVADRGEFAHLALVDDVAG